eukprot:jgi/Mesvir1/14300/Mv09724-RA.1
MASLQAAKDKGVNVQVLVRCRPTTEGERKTQQALKCEEKKGEVTVVQSIAGKTMERTFTFDKVFGPSSTQEDVFEQSVVPIVNEVLEGFNCTIFAYGQTGTGKTYTMEGVSKNSKSDEALPAAAGVIPRAVRHIFDALEAQHAEYSVKVAFMELYNEELTDLLASGDPRPLAKTGPVVGDDDKKRALSLMEDGKGGVIVRGLEEEMVRNFDEIFTVLEKGSAKRRTAETLLNKQSSRSHSVFTITIHIKESTPEGEELIKCGKLNLVDLAGSENISRSGAKEGRAREAGEINKSLLTLGRVITSLVEHQGHVPYRDSKLTRMLRDSLGGRTKTCIIATVSPNLSTLEETLNTLDYAHRAKNIKNRPEVNQKLCKAEHIKDLSGEINRLRAELLATREKNGVYIPTERYAEEERHTREMEEKVAALEGELEMRLRELAEITGLFEDKARDYEVLAEKQCETERALGETSEALATTQVTLARAEEDVSCRDYLIARHRVNEDGLLGTSHSLRDELAITSDDVAGLFGKIDRKTKVEEGNAAQSTSFKGMLGGRLAALQSNISEAVAGQQERFADMDGRLAAFAERKGKDLECLVAKAGGFQEALTGSLGQVAQLAQEYDESSKRQLSSITDMQVSHGAEMTQMVAATLEQAQVTIRELQAALVEQSCQMVAFALSQREALAQAVTATAGLQQVLAAGLQSIDEVAGACSATSAQELVAQEASLNAFLTSFEEKTRAHEARLLDDVALIVNKFVRGRAAHVASAVDDLKTRAAVANGSVQASLATVRTTAQEAVDKGAALVAASHTQGDAAAAANQASDTMLSAMVDASGKSVKHLEELLLTASRDVTERETGRVAVLKDGMSHATGLNDTFQAALSQQAQSTLERVRQQVDDISAFAADANEKDQAEVSEVRAAVRGVNEDASNMSTACGSDVDDVKAFVESFNFQRDIPTGKTPLKRSIEVPLKDAIETFRTPAPEVVFAEARAQLLAKLPEGNEEDDHTETGETSPSLEENVASFPDENVVFTKPLAKAASEIAPASKNGYELPSAIPRAPLGTRN